MIHFRTQQSQKVYPISKAARKLHAVVFVQVLPGVAIRGLNWQKLKWEILSTEVITNA